MLDEEKKAIDKLKAGEKIGIYELIRTFKREGIENFVITRKKYVDTLLNLIEKQQKEIKSLKKENLEIRDWKYTIDTIEDLDKLKELDLIKIKGKDYISKDKIKAKIEDYSKMIKATYEDFTHYADYRRDVCLEIKNVLNELLEE